MRVYKNFISPEIDTPDAIIPAKIVDGADALKGGPQRGQRFRAVFATDEELQLGVAGKSVLGT